MVPKTSELLPEPDTPVKTVSRRFGISRLTSLRLFTRAPVTRIRSWLSATCSICCSDSPAAIAHQLPVGQFVRLAPGLDAAWGDAEPTVGRGQLARIEAGARHEP